MPENKLEVTDARTGRAYELPITDGTIRAMDLRKIKTGEDDFGLLAHDPAFTNTTSCRSSITYIDGDKGVLEYRGYPIEQLAEATTFPEVAWLLLEGELPKPAELDAWRRELQDLAELPEGVLRALDGFPRDAHPMSKLMAVVSALGGHQQGGQEVRDPQYRRRHIRRILAQMPLCAAAVWRHGRGLEQMRPRRELSYAEKFLKLVQARDAADDRAVDATLAHAMDVLFTLHADHEQNCSTSTMRIVGSSEAGPYACASAAIAALSGPLHGGANEAVLRMLERIGSKDGIPRFLEQVKDKQAKLMGFGHRVYKSYDPRAKIIAKIAKDVFAVTGRNPLLEIAVELERIALEEEYFVERNLYPNVDFYSGLIYQSLGFTPDYFTVLFAVGRTPGWLAQWNELMEDKEQKIARPRQIYLGARDRKFVPLADRR